jgi:small subunit ribosomal protein S3
VGQKTHPRGLRIGIIESWESTWYEKKDYAKWLHEDLALQKFIKDRLFRAGISRTEIKRKESGSAGTCTVRIHTARPGIVIGRRGSETEQLQSDLEELIGRPVRIEVEEIKRPELDAQLVAEAVSMQILRRANFRQAMKKTIESSMKAGAQGCKIAVSGRLGGAEMARSESAIQGRVPLHTLRANVDYGFAEAATTYGKIGIKTWIFKGEIIGDPFDEDAVASRISQLPSTGESRRRRSRRSRSSSSAGTN